MIDTETKVVSKLAKVQSQVTRNRGRDKEM